ncbi:MAG: hypothetical protein AVDCRST_MAG50-3035 [uncultured Acidimicrobiales bacterium]|uniref:Glycosyltransferase RgtA/B/C/D-like domain-containing protein n=1 Tax=uncultured Acidimicrobiales bacterium TaxID=310071 RepID=A0A6J4J0T0_9ACTN|nr:MAG: hypothetical protein AVDCRST_MAG50-3035 [uncultured Acidimicrobiales bacterium]
MGPRGRLTLPGVGDPVNATSARARAAFAALALLVLVPFVTSAFDIGRGWVPVGDTAIVATRARDVFTAESPLLGQPSTAGDRVGRQVYHPGPLEFWVLAVAQRVSDTSGVTLWVTTAINAGAAITLLFWVRRIGGLAVAALACPFLLTLLWSLRGDLIVNPLNPLAAVLPFSASLVALVAASSGRRWAVTSAVLFGSYAAQAHLTFTGLVGAAAMAAVAFAGVRTLRGTPAGRKLTPDRRRRAFVVFVALALCWAAPAVDAVLHEGGNVGALLSTGSALSQETIGSAQAVDISVRAIGLRPAWAQAGMDGPSLLARPTSAQRLSAAMLLVAGLVVSVACRRRAPAVGAAFAVSLSVLVAGTALMSRIPNEIVNITSIGNFLWLWPTSTLLWATPLFGIGSLLVLRAPRPSARIAPALAVTAAAALAVACVVTPSHRPAPRDIPRYTHDLVRQLEGRLDRDLTYTFDIDRRIRDNEITHAVMHQLIRRGFDLRVQEGFEASFGDRRSQGHERTGGTLVLQRDRSPAPPPVPGADLVAQWVPPEESLLRLRVAEEQLARRIELEGGTDAVVLALPGAPPETRSPAELATGPFTELVDLRFTVAEARVWKETKALGRAVSAPIYHVTVHLVPPAPAPVPAG